MSGKTIRLFAVSALLTAGAAAASAQTAISPTTESVTVMGSREAYHTFPAGDLRHADTGHGQDGARWENAACARRWSGRNSPLPPSSPSTSSMSRWPPAHPSTPPRPAGPTSRSSSPPRRRSCSTPSARTIPTIWAITPRSPREMRWPRSTGSHPGLVCHRDHRPQGQKPSGQRRVDRQRQQDRQPAQPFHRDWRRVEHARPDPGPAALLCLDRHPAE